MGAANQSQVTLGTNAMSITREPVASNTPEVYPYKLITSVVPVKINSKANVQTIDKPQWKYRFPVMTIIEIGLFDGRRINIELQEITNQPTWSTGTLLGQQTAVADILAVL